MVEDDLGSSQMDGINMTPPCHLLSSPAPRLCREEDGRGLFGKYPHLKKLHHARTNLAVTSQLSEFFYTIPQRAEGLIK